MNEGANGPYTFDSCSKRWATGLIQDLCNSLETGIAPYTRELSSLLFIILNEESITTDVKIFGICAIGDLCLNSEA